MRVYQTLRTKVIAAFAARRVGRDRSAFGAGGGWAAIWGEAAFGERFFAVGGFKGLLEEIASGGVSPSSGDGEGDFDSEELAVGGAGRS